MSISDTVLRFRIFDDRDFTQAFEKAARMVSMNRFVTCNLLGWVSALVLTLATFSGAYGQDDEAPSPAEQKVSGVSG